MVTRVLLFVCTALTALCLVQWRVLQERKAQVAPVNYRAALAELNGRREEIARVVEWIRATASRPPTPPRELCKAGEPDKDALMRTFSDVYVYLIARHAGASEAQARQQVLDALATGAETTGSHEPEPLESASTAPRTP